MRNPAAEDHNMFVCYMFLELGFEVVLNLTWTWTVIELFLNLLSWSSGSSVCQSLYLFCGRVCGGVWCFARPFSSGACGLVFFGWTVRSRSIVGSLMLRKPKSAELESLFFRPTPLGSRQVVQHAVLHAAVVNFWLKNHPSSEKWVAKDRLDRCLHSHHRPSECQPRQNKQTPQKAKRNKTQQNATKQTQKGALDRRAVGNVSAVWDDDIASSPVLVWQKTNKTTQTTTSRHHHTKVCEGRTNTALCGNQGTPSRSPEITQSKLSSWDLTASKSNSNPTASNDPVMSPMERWNTRWNRTRVKIRSEMELFRSSQRVLRLLSVPLYQTSSSWWHPSAPEGHQSKLGPAN